MWDCLQEHEQVKGSYTTELEPLTLPRNSQQCLCMYHQE